METLRLSDMGNDYEDALAKCFVRLKNICGNPDAQIFRREAGINPRILVDWVLETAKAETTLGGTSIHVEAEFFLWGSDE